MSEIANSLNSDVLASGGDDGALASRIFRVMLFAVAFAVIASATFAPWRVTTGLLLGGMLSLLNHHWLRTSVAAAFDGETAGKRPRMKAWRFVLRYFLIAAVVAAAWKLSVVSLPATIVGLSSFVVALFAEAFRSSYFIVVHREEN